MGSRTEAYKAGKKKKENAMKRKSLHSFSNSWHWKDTAAYKLMMPRMLRHSVTHTKADEFMKETKRRRRG